MPAVLIVIGALLIIGSLILTYNNYRWQMNQIIEGKGEINLDRVLLRFNKVVVTHKGCSDACLVLGMLTLFVGLIII